MIAILILNIVVLILAGIVCTILLSNLLMIKKRYEGIIRGLKTELDVWKRNAERLDAEIEELKRGRQ